MEMDMPRWWCHVFSQDRTGVAEKILYAALHAHQPKHYTFILTSESIWCEG